MSRVTLEFDMDNPDDKDEYKIIFKANDMYCFIHSMQNLLRDARKGRRFWNEDKFEFERFMEEIFDLEETYNISSII